LCVPVFANPGAAFFRTPGWTELDPSLAIDAAVEAERLGYHSVWVADHLMHGYDDGILEGWTTLSVIAGRTSRIQLGTIHLAQPFRAPALAAKMAATLDALSGGRVIFFYDCGWQAAEVRAYGLDWPSEDERIARMDEGLDLIKALWTSEEPLDFRGTFFSTQGAMCRPAPRQKPRPPIWLGEARHPRWLETMVRHADGWNSTPASPAALSAKLDAVRGACERSGKNFKDLELSLEIQLLIAPTENEVKDIARKIVALAPSKRGEIRQDIVSFLENGGEGPLNTVVDDWLVGTPEAIRDQLKTYEDLGISHFMLWFLDFPSLDGMRLFSEHVSGPARANTVTLAAHGRSAS
jgi:alkanesulfonate monooxygenase SsuD/methylene tetrahydromethanopterin reductase-like flavin-dependent oxidoreductase (luciferase family)